MRTNLLAEKLTLTYKSKSPAHCFVGFDGFTDEIVVPLKDGENPFPTIASFAERIARAAGKSSNIELILREKKIGGNAPILADALLEGGHLLTLAGCLGEKTIEPLFVPLTKRCKEVFSLTASGHSEALEFTDGKIILGKMSQIKTLTLKEVLARIGMNKLFEILEKSTLFVSANWTMLPMMNDLWRYILEEIAPNLTPRNRYLFVDLADPAKRSDADLEEALLLLKGLNSTFQVILGLNCAEAERLALLYSISDQIPPEDLAKKLKVTTQFTEIIIHSSKQACVAFDQSCIAVKTPYTSTPYLTTGAGDNFNAGYCNALLYEFEPEERLLNAVATAGFYVRNGESPTMEELAFFLTAWDKGCL